jgi:hypothetical protein
VVVKSTPFPVRAVPKAVAAIVEEPFQPLIPRLSEGWRFTAGMVTEDSDGTPRLSLMYSASPGTGFSISQASVEATDQMVELVWTRIERGERTIELSSVDPTVEATTLEELIEVALSLEPAGSDSPLASGHFVSSLGEANEVGDREPMYQRRWSARRLGDRADTG